MPGGSSGGSSGGGKAQTTIIDIPIPKVDTTELEVVHVFPQGMGGGGGYGGYNNYPNGIPSFSVVSQENGTTQTSNVWGFNPGSIARKLNKNKDSKEKSSIGASETKLTKEGLSQKKVGIPQNTIDNTEDKGEQKKEAKVVKLEIDPKQNEINNSSLII